MSYDSVEKSVYSAEPVECYRFATDSGVLRLTSSDMIRNINVGSDGAQDYLPETIARTAPDFSQEADAGSIEVSIPATSSLALMYAAQNPKSETSVIVYRKHISDAGIVVIFSGVVASVEFRESECVLRCLRLRNSMGRMMPKLIYQKTCNLSLYGARCAANRNTFKQTAIVTATSGATLTSTTFGGHADGWWVGGWIERADGRKAYITGHTGNVVTTMDVLPLSLPATVTAYPGCDKTETTCQNKFSNLANHFGFARIPIKNPYETGLV